MQSLKTEAQYGRAKFYHSDGTGRDGYIANDNGGLTQQLDRCRQPPVGKLMISINRWISLSQIIESF